MPTFIHGKSTVIKINSKDLSLVTKSSELSRGADTHDTTGYGLDDYTFQGGLRKADFTAEGTYDSTAVTGPRAVLAPIIGQTVPLIRQPEGTGSGKPQDSCSIVIEEFVESSPYNDMVKWSVKGKVSGAVNTTAQ